MKKFSKKIESAKISTIKTTSYAILVASHTLDAVKLWWIAVIGAFNRCPICGETKSFAEVKDMKGNVTSSLIYCENCEQSTFQAFKNLHSRWLGKEVPKA